MHLYFIGGPPCLWDVLLVLKEWVGWRWETTRVPYYWKSSYIIQLDNYFYGYGHFYMMCIKLRSEITDIDNLWATWRLKIPFWSDINLLVVWSRYMQLFPSCIAKIQIEREQFEILEKFRYGNVEVDKPWGFSGVLDWLKALQSTFILAKIHLNLLISTNKKMYNLFAPDITLPWSIKSPSRCCMEYWKLRNSKETYWWILLGMAHTRPSSLFILSKYSSPESPN